MFRSSSDLGYLTQSRFVVLKARIINTVLPDILISLSLSIQAMSKKGRDLAGKVAKARVVATINNGSETLLDSVLYTSATENGNHVIESTFQVPAHADCLKITVSLSFSELIVFLLQTHSIAYVFVMCFNPISFFASFIQLIPTIPVGLIPVSACPRPHSTPLPAHLSNLPPTVQPSQSAHSLPILSYIFWFRLSLYLTCIQHRLDHKPFSMLLLLFHSLSFIILWVN